MTDETREKLKDIVTKKPLQTAILKKPENAVSEVDELKEQLAAANGRIKELELKIK